MTGLAVGLGTETPETDAQRAQLSKLRSLLVLSQLMTESSSERQILELAVGAAQALAPCDTAAIRTDGGQWFPGDPTRGSGELAEHPEAGGSVDLPGRRWARTYPILSVRGNLGLLLVGAESEPDPHEQFLLRALAQQTGAALANRRLHEKELQAARELAEANERQGETLEALQRSIAIHERLTDVAASGHGREGIARAVHELTGYPVAIEDRYGNLRAWAGPNRPDPYPKDPAARREQLLRRALHRGAPIRDGGRVVAVARPQHDVVGVLVLVDPAHTVGDAQLRALEHGTTVLAMELARLRSLAETELRLRRDLVEEVLSGTDEESALRRAQALGYDLERPHRVVLVEGRGRDGDEDAFLHATRRAARDEPVGSLVSSRGRSVVVLASHDADWEHYRRAVLRELGGGRCRIGVGGSCTRVEDFPRSLRQAELALKVQHATAGDDQATVFEELGVYQLLAEADDPEAVEAYARRWLGALLRYDEEHDYELVDTLRAYLECGGNYEDTATRLFIHRSTLKYRLKRIREISGLDLSDPDTRFNLHLATRTWTTIRAMRD